MSELAEILRNLEYLKNLEKSWLDKWVFPFLPLILSVLAIFIATYNDDIKQWRRKRNSFFQVKVANDGKLYKQEKSDGKIDYVGRIEIENTGKFKMEDVQIDVIRIYENEEKRKNFLQSPLNWTHSEIFSGDKNYRPVRSIHPGQKVSLDILNFNKEKNSNERTLRLVVLGGKHIDDFSKLKESENEIELKLYQKSGKTETIKLKILFQKEQEDDNKKVRVKIL